MLGQRKKNPQNAGNRPYHNQQPAPPGRRGPQQHRRPHQTVNAGFYHYPAHHRRNMTGSGRMGMGKPYMQRHKARLCPKPDNRQQEQKIGLGRRKHRDFVEIQRPCAAAEQNKEKNKECCADMHRNKIAQPRLANRGLFILEAHQKERGNRHNFPRYQKQQTVAGSDDQHHPNQKQRVKKPRNAKVFSALVGRKILNPVNGRDRRQPQDGNQEESRQRIKPQTKRTKRHRPCCLYRLSSAAEKDLKSRNDGRNTAGSSPQNTAQRGQSPSAPAEKGGQTANKNNSKTTNKKGHRILYFPWE